MVRETAIEQTFNGSAGFGKRVTCQISRNGDLIHRVYLQATVPAFADYVEYLGLRLIKNVEIEIGGQRIDKHYSEWMYIWNELSLPTGKRDGYDAMVGKTVPNAATTLYIPLEFWFCRNVGLALPLIALQYHEVKINIDFETKTNCITEGSLTGDLEDASLWVDYIFLDTDERRRFAQLSHEYLIEQLQFTGDESISGSTNRIKLNFNHPCKELVWVVQKDDSTWNNFEVEEINPVASAKLQLNGHDRFAERDGTYFNLVQPFQHHENVPSDKGINVYSFALRPEEHQPTGTLNMSRIDTAVLSLTTTEDTGSAKVKVFAVNYNVLRIMSGINHLYQTVSCQYGYFASILGKQCKRNLRYNWLVESCIKCNQLQQTQIVGKLLRALTTTHGGKLPMRTPGNDRGYSKNVKDWTIRSQAPAVRMTMNRVKVQRADGFGDERFVNLFDSLRCAPHVNESSYILRPGVVSLIPTNRNISKKLKFQKNKKQSFLQSSMHIVVSY